MLKVADAWRDLAPDKKFGGKTLAEFEAQVERSLTPRKNLAKLKTQEAKEITARNTEDSVTMADIEAIVGSVIGDPTEGPDSALYEMMGYVKKSDRKSGLTRKKKNPQD